MISHHGRSFRFPVWMGSDLRRLWAGQFLLRVAWAALLVAGGFVLKEVHDSPAWNAWLLWLLVTPGLLVTPLAGVTADRLHPRLPMAAAGAVLALAMGLVTVSAITATATTTAVVLLSAAGLASLAMAFYGSAEDVLLASLVPGRHLASAYAIDEGSGHLSELAGAAAAGAFLAAAGVGMVFGFIAIAAAIAMLFSLRLRSRCPAVPGGTIAASLRAGLTHLRQHTGFLLFQTMQALVLATIAALGAMLPYYIEDQLGQDATWMPTLSMALALGGVAGMLLAGRPVWDGARRACLIPASVASLGAGLMALGKIHTTGTALIVLALCSASLACGIIQARTLAMLSIPEALRGRLLSWVEVLTKVATLVTVLLIGHAADQLAPARRGPVVLSCAGLSCVVVALLMVGLPSVRRHLAERLATGYA